MGVLEECMATSTMQENGLLTVYYTWDIITRVIIKLLVEFRVFSS